MDLHFAVSSDLLPNKRDRGTDDTGSKSYPRAHASHDDGRFSQEQQQGRTGGRASVVAHPRKQSDCGQKMKRPMLEDGCDPGAAQTGDRATDTESFRR